MRSIWRVLAPIVAGAIASLGAVSVHAEPKELRYGFWVETYRGFDYRVDTKAQLCFAVIHLVEAAGLTRIPCEDLAKREEWKPILTWVGTSGGASGEAADR